MAERNYWVMCDDNCRFPAMTKEQTLTAIEQAVSTGTIKNVDTGFVQTIKTITGQPLRFFVGTQAEYEALTAEEKQNLFAIITNDTAIESINAAIESLSESLGADVAQLRQDVKGLNRTLGSVSDQVYDIGAGNVSVPLADNATTATEAVILNYSALAPQELTWQIDSSGKPYCQLLGSGLWLLYTLHDDGNATGFGTNRYREMIGVVYFDGETRTKIEFHNGFWQIDESGLLTKWFYEDAELPDGTAYESVKQSNAADMYTTVYARKIGNDHG